MMRSIAASMISSSSFGSDQFGGFKPCNRLVGEADPVEFAALKHLDDNSKQSLVGRISIGNNAGAAQIVLGDGIGITDHLDIHHPQSTLDQHDLQSSDTEG